MPRNEFLCTQPKLKNSCQKSGTHVHELFDCNQQVLDIEPLRMRIILERLACDMDDYTLQYREGLDVDDTAQVAKPFF